MGGSVRELLMALLASSMVFHSSESMKRDADSRQSESPKRLKSDNQTGWDYLPAEMQQIIYGSLADNDSLTKTLSLVAVLKEICNKRLICSQANHVIADSVFFKSIARRYVQLRPDDAVKEFFQACASGNVFISMLLKRSGIDLNAKIIPTEEQLKLNFQEADWLKKFLFEKFYYFKGYKNVIDMLDQLCWYHEHYMPDMIDFGPMTHETFEGSHMDLTFGNIACLLAVSSKCTYLIKEFIAYDVWLDPAAYYDERDSAQMLIQHGASIHQSELTLLNAVKENNREMVKLLLKYGARPGTNCWANIYDFKIFRLLLTFAKPTTKNVSKQFVYSIILNDIPGVQQCLEQGIDINEELGIDFDELTPLMVAAELGYFDLVLFLLNYGADINKTVDEMSALTVARENKQLDIEQLLIHRGAQ